MTNRYTGTGVEAHCHQTKYQYGCEIEFYVDTDRYTVEDAAEMILGKLIALSAADTLVDLLCIPTDDDRHNCFMLKPDQSLKSNGLEISTPIASKDAIIRFMKEIFSLIEKVGYTNEDTGLHFHISTIEKNGVNINFYEYMLICHEEGLLNTWGPRNSYSKNVMEILSRYDKSKSRKIKNKKDGEWSLEKKSNNHVEIRTIGGDYYHTKIEQVIQDFEKYSELFELVHKREDLDRLQAAVKKHKEMVKQAETVKLVEHMKALKASGIEPFLDQ